jgi:hypothetical protein
MKWSSGKPDRRKKLGRPRKRGRPRKVIESEKRPSVRSKESERKAVVYAKAVDSGMTQKAARSVAGYAETSRVHNYPAVRKAFHDIEAQREELQGEDGFRLRDVATRFKNRATNKKVSARDQTSNDKALVDVLGYAAEKKISVSNTSLLLEFTNMTSDDLARTRERILAGEDD